jgi:hypothetical protein
VRTPVPFVGLFCSSAIFFKKQCKRRKLKLIEFEDAVSNQEEEIKMETRRKSLSNLLPRRQSLNNLLPRRKNSQKHHRKSSKAANGDREDDEPPPILGGQIEEIKSTLKLKRKDFIKCWSVFRHHDLNNNGYYTLDEVLNGIVIGEPRTSFVETVFELSDVQDLNRIEYGELFYTIATFCMFEVRQ